MIYKPSPTNPVKYVKPGSLEHFVLLGAGAKVVGIEYINRTKRYVMSFNGEAIKIERQWPVTQWHYLQHRGFDLYYLLEDGKPPSFTWSFKPAKIRVCVKCQGEINTRVACAYTLWPAYNNPFNMKYIFCSACIDRLVKANSRSRENFNHFKPGEGYATYPVKLIQ